MKKILIIALILFSTSLFAFPTSWWVNGNGYTGLLIYKVNPNNNKVTGKLLGTPVEGYLVGRHLVLHRYPNGKTQIWEGWIKDKRLRGNIPSYNNDYFLAGTISVKGNSLYPWFGIATGKTAGVSNTGFNTNTQPIINNNIIGKWKWFDGGTVIINKNGTVTSKYGNNGKWKAIQTKTGIKYIINWNKGLYIDTLTLSGNMLKGKNQYGTNVWGQKIGKSLTSSIITNGSFEYGPKNVNDYLTLYAGSTKLLGWKIERGSIDIIERYWKSSNGKRSIDLCGATCSTISQVIKTIPGRVYQLSFDLSGNGYVNEIKTIRVKIGNLEKVFKFNTYGKNTTKMGWQKHSFNYKSVSNMTRVVFDAPDNLNSSIAGPAIDNVQLKLIR